MKVCETFVVYGACGGYVVGVWWICGGCAAGIMLCAALVVLFSSCYHGHGTWNGAAAHVVDVGFLSFLKMSFYVKKP